MPKKLLSARHVRYQILNDLDEKWRYGKKTTAPNI
jgi:hypothetical protein